MATIKTTDGDVQLFTQADVYRFEVDNRPLRVLIENDIAVNAELETVRDEVIQARTGIYSTYPSLDARLDDLEIGSGLPIKQVNFAEFMARANDQMARYASGFVAPLTEVFRLNELHGEGTFGSSGSMFADYGANSFGNIFLRDAYPNAEENRVTLGTGFGLNYNPGTGAQTFAKSSPVPLFIRGMQVRLHNEAGGATATGFANDVTWNLPAAPSAGLRVDLLWVEVWFQNVSRATPSFYSRGAVGSLASPITAPDDPFLAGTIGFHGANGGDYFQLQHRLRVTSGVNPEFHQFGMSDPLVLARGGSGVAQAGYVFTNGTKGAFAAFRDPGVWIAGAGDAPSKAALGTLDGYVYAIPVALVFRRNTAQWTHSNQNGTRTSTGTGTWLTNDSARPDGYFHDKIEKDDIVLIAPSCVTGKHDLKRLMDESFDRLLRGKLQTRHGYLRYDDQYAEWNYAGNAEPVAGAVISSVNSISATPLSKTDQFFDENGTQKSTPDDFRRVFGAQPETEPIGFSLNLQTSVFTPANFVSFGAGTISIKAVGQSVGDINAVISEAPILWWSGSKQPVAITTGVWAGLGSGTITASLNTGDTFYSATGTIIGFVKVTFGGTYNGFKKPNISTVGQTYVDPLLAESPFVGLGILSTGERLLAPTGVFSTAASVYIADSLAHKVWKLNATTFAVEASFGVYGAAAADNTHLTQPTQLTVDGSGNVFVCDSSNRVVKLDSSLAYVGQFGVTNSAGTDATHLSVPRGVAVDGSGNVYVSDYINFRVIKLNASLVYEAQFGVTGISVSDATHCAGPKGLTFASDNLLYVADTSRVLVLTAALEVAGFIEPGNSVPSTQGSTSYGIRPNNNWGIRTDASGNRYVGGWFPTPTGIGGFCMTKYDSNWDFVVRYGGAFDTGGALQGGINAGTPNGLCYVQAWDLDEANGSIVMIEFNPNGTGILANGTQPSYSQSRAIVLNMSDLTLKYPVKYGLQFSGPVSPYGPLRSNRFWTGAWAWETPPNYLGWPEYVPGAMAIDTNNRYAYIACTASVDPVTGNTAQWSRIEKWACPTDDPDTWTYTTHFGHNALAYGPSSVYWQAWADTSHNATRIKTIANQDMGLCMLADGSAVFVSDNHTVLKLNSQAAGLSYIGRFGYAGVPGSDTSHMNFQDLYGDGKFLVAGIQVCGTGLADSTARVYVGDIRNNRLVILKANTGWGTAPSAAAYSSAYTGNPRQNASVWYPMGNDQPGNTLWMRTWGWASGEGWELDLTGHRDSPVFVEPTAGVTVTTFVPVQLNGLPTGAGNNIMGTAVDDGILYWVDYGTNQLVAINLADYRFIGECGTAGIGGSDKANVNGPVAITAYAKKIFVADYRNSRIFKSHRVFAHVQQKIGRVEFLVPPEQTSKWYGYSKHSAYQGVVLKGKPTGVFTDTNTPLEQLYPSLAGRAVLMPPEKMLVTTLGRGSVEYLRNPGITAYANCIGMLPIPPNSPDEKDVAPRDFNLKGSVLSGHAHYLLPVMNVEAASAGQFPGENESFWERKTTILNKDTGGVGVRGGVQSYFAGTTAIIWRPRTPLFPVVSTLDCDTAPTYRYLVTPFLVVVEGEVLLAVRIEGAASGKTANEVGSSSIDIIELFRPIGHPMLKDNGESGAIITRT